MQRLLALALFAAFVALPVAAQVPKGGPAAAGKTGTSTASQAAPLPDPRSLLLDVERNDRRLEALRRDYTYHVRLEEQELGKNGGVKRISVIDSESLTIAGMRVNRVVARDGHPLTPDEQARESERVDKEVAKGKERRARALARGEQTDDRGDAMLSAARILELGRFTNERRIEWNGRPTIVLDYAGDPNAKTHSAMEGIVRDLVGTVWIDEADRVLVRGEGHFLNDFRIGGGLLADVRKGTSFRFEATRVHDAVWLPATVEGQGSIRLLLFAGFNGRMDLTTSNYRQFHTSATILPGQREVNQKGEPSDPGEPTVSCDPIVAEPARPVSTPPDKDRPARTQP